MRCPALTQRVGPDTNYKELEILYQKYQERGFVVLAFPCNQFGNQEPGTPPAPHSLRY